MSELHVCRTALVFPSSTDELSPFLTCDIASSDGQEGETVLISSPLETESGPRSFTFDSIVVCQGRGTPHRLTVPPPTPALTATAAAAAAAQERRRVCVAALIHGSVSSLSIKRFFKETVENLTRDVVTGSLPGLTERAGERGESTFSFSVVRAYSWGATDVLRKSIVERNLLTPSRSPPHHHHGDRSTTTTLVGSEYVEHDDEESSVLHCKVHRDTFEEEDLPVIARALRETLRVPDGHSAVKYSLVQRSESGDTVCTYTVGLLPQLRRANHLFRDDLLNLRDVFQRGLNPHDGDRVGRLARLFLDVSPDAVNQLHVLTAIDGSAPYEETNLLQCWYGSRSTAQPTPVWLLAPSPVTSLQTGGLSVDDSHWQSGHDHSLDSAAKQLFRSPANAAPLSPLGPNTNGCSGPESPIPAPKSSQSSSLVMPPSPGQPLPDTGREEAPTTLATSESEHRTLCGAESESPSVVVRNEELREPSLANPVGDEKADLERQKSELRNEIESLEAYKATLERFIGQHLLSLGEGVLQELEDAESAMLSEVSRAQTILGISQASALAQEQQLLSRLTLLSAELGHSMTPPERHRTQSSARSRH